MDNIVSVAKDDADRKGERVIIPVSASLLVEIDDFRFANRIPSRSEAIRTLIRRALEASRKQEACRG